jgi:hypothetical protein
VFWFGFAGVHAGYYSLHCYPAPCPGYKAGHYSLHCYPGDIFSSGRSLGWYLAALFCHVPNAEFIQKQPVKTFSVF